MTTEQFAYWLQGYMELSGEGGMTASQKQVIKDHLKEVFEKRTPYRDPTLTTTTYPTNPEYGVAIC